MIQVMIADDQLIIREGLRKILSLDEEIKIVCEAANGYEILDQLTKCTVDVILMDVRMPKMDGIAATAKIKRLYPTVKIIILTTFNEEQYLFDGIKNGISGYILKGSDVDFIVRSIKDVFADRMMFDSNVTPKLVDAISKSMGSKENSRLHELTERELEIAKLVAKGLSNREIADTVFLSEGTVKNNISIILSKLELQRRTQISIVVNDSKL